MTLQLNGLSERVEIYKDYFGKMEYQMPLLVSGRNKRGEVVDVSRVPISFDELIERRVKCPPEVAERWRNNPFVVGDVSISGTEGDNLVVLDSQLFRQITPKSELYLTSEDDPDRELSKAWVLSSRQTWKELRAYKEGVLHLTAEEVKKANGKGYIKKGGVWVPANRVVGKVLDFLNRGKDLSDYVQLCVEMLAKMRGKEEEAYFYFEGHRYRYQLMGLSFNQTTVRGKPTLRPFYGLGIADGGAAMVCGDKLLTAGCGDHLIGVSREADLEMRTLAAIKEEQPFEWYGKGYKPTFIAKRFISYNVGFTRKPKLAELDEFMRSFGFEALPAEACHDSEKGLNDCLIRHLTLQELQKYKPEKVTKVYVWRDEPTYSEIRFVYGNKIRSHQYRYGEMGKEVKAYGWLITHFNRIVSRHELDDELNKIIQKKAVKTEWDFYKQVDPERLKFYETALALRNHYNAFVLEGEKGSNNDYLMAKDGTSEEINPKKPLALEELKEKFWVR